MQVEHQLLAEGIVKLAKKIRDTKYVSAIVFDNQKLRIDYSNGYNQKIDIPIIKEESITIIDNNKEIQEVKKQITNDLKENHTFLKKAHKKQSDELNKAKKELKLELNKHFDGEVKKIAAEYSNIAKDNKKELLTLLTELEQKLIDFIEKSVSNIEVKDGVDGQDADEKKIFAELKYLLKEELTNDLQKGLEEIKSSIPEVKNGKDGQDADEEAIFSRLEKKLESAVINIKVKDGIDGIDGQDADEEVITERIRLLLLDKLNSYVNEATTKIDEALLKKEEELKIAILDIIKAQIALIPQAKDGQDGKDGQDANEEKIKDQVLADVELQLQQKTLTSFNQLKELVITLVANIPVPEAVKGDKGDKGEDGKSIKGDKGEKGNGIKSAKIDNLGDLIIYTDEKKINAGKVGITNVYGGIGSGGGGSGSSNPFYTNTMPIPYDIGQIKAGTRFKNADLRVVFTKLFYGFDFPEFEKFFVQDINKADIGGIFEIGYKVLTGDYSFHFNIINPELFEEGSIFIEQDGQLLADKLNNTSLITISLSEFQKVTTSNTTFKIFGYDTTGVTFQKDYIIQYYYRIYYGEYTEDITDWTSDPDINPLTVLRATELVSDIKGEYLFLGIAYKWFCYPESLGENYIFYELTSDIAVIFEEPRKITITNEYGLQIIYNCYKTVNEINEEFTMGIK